jgi:hypothetical protein
MQLGLISDWKLETRSWWLLSWFDEESPWSRVLSYGDHLSNHECDNNENLQTINWSRISRKKKVQWLAWPGPALASHSDCAGFGSSRYSINLIITALLNLNAPTPAACTSAENWGLLRLICCMSYYNGIIAYYCNYWLWNPIIGLILATNYLQYFGLLLAIKFLWPKTLLLLLIELYFMN